VRIASSYSAAPARRGAFVDEPHIVPATQATEYGRETLIPFRGQCGSSGAVAADGRPITQNLRCARRAGVAANSSFGGAVAHTRPTRVLFAHARLLLHQE
jgi:hypothetical protein